jgi:hypothetical protein
VAMSTRPMAPQKAAAAVGADALRRQMERPRAAAAATAAATAAADSSRRAAQRVHRNRTRVAASVSAARPAARPATRRAATLGGAARPSTRRADQAPAARREASAARREASAARREASAARWGREAGASSTGGARVSPSNSSDTGTGLRMSCDGYARRANDDGVAGRRRAVGARVVSLTVTAVVYRLRLSGSCALFHVRSRMRVVERNDNSKFRALRVFAYKIKSAV